MSITAGKGPFPFGFFRMAGSINGFPSLSSKLDLIVTFSAKHIEINNTRISMVRMKHFLYIISFLTFRSSSILTSKMRQESI